MENTKRTPIFPRVKKAEPAPTPRPFVRMLDTPKPLYIKIINPRWYRVPRMKKEKRWGNE
jgi:hypothetical protein